MCTISLLLANTALSKDVQYRRKNTWIQVGESVLGFKRNNLPVFGASDGALLFTASADFDPVQPISSFLY